MLKLNTEAGSCFIVGRNGWYPSLLHWYVCTTSLLVLQSNIRFYHLTTNGEPCLAFVNPALPHLPRNHLLNRCTGVRRNPSFCYAEVREHGNLLCAMKFWKTHTEVSRFHCSAVGEFNFADFYCTLIFLISWILFFTGYLSARLFWWWWCFYCMWTWKISICPRWLCPGS